MVAGREILIAHDLMIGYSGQQGKTIVMDNINISACSGELVALIGKNGSGKSTLLRNLVSLQSPLSGKILLKGLPLHETTRTGLTKTVSFVSTEPVTVHNIKVREAVSLGRFPYTNWLGTLSADDEVKIEEALYLTELNNLADRKIEQLSDGERQRVLIARSLAQDTELLVMDEPTAFLDLPSRFGIVSLLRKLSREKNKCIVFSTHDLDTALNEADKIWLMQTHTLCQGAPEDLVLNKSLSKAFENPSLSFSISSGTFSFVRKPKGTVSLEGTGNLKKWTERALMRSDYKIEPDSGCHVTVSQFNDRVQWSITLNDSNPLMFYTIYDMINYLAGAVDFNLT